jgi:MFS family permease
MWAGVAISSQYLATLVTRPKAGRMTDVLGPRATVLVGQVAGLLSGLCLLAAASQQSKTLTFCRSSDKPFDPWLWRKLGGDGCDHLFGDFPLWLRSSGLRACVYSAPLSLGS